jgi:prolyl-tRNA synthetase
MTHSDDDGIVLPPRVASAHVVLMPIIRKEKDRQQVMEYTESLKKELEEITYCGRPLVVELDDRDIGGARGWEWIKKGIPLRVEIGPRDIAENAVFVGRRDKPHKEKTSMKKEEFTGGIVRILEEMQNTYFSRALSFQKEHTRHIDNKEEFREFFTPENPENPELHGGFALSHWCGSEACENNIKEDLSVTIRCIPFNSEAEKGVCIHCDNSSDRRVVFAKAY